MSRRSIIHVFVFVVVVAVAIIFVAPLAPQIGRWIGGTFSGSDSPALVEARDSIQVLERVLSARADSLEALAAAHRSAAAAYDSVAAAADSLQDELAVDAERADMDVDSLAAVLRARADSAMKRVVDQIVARHNDAMDALRAALVRENEAHRAALLLARSAQDELYGVQIDNELLRQVHEEHEIVESERTRQVRALKWQRNGAIAVAILAIVCAAAC